MVKLTRCRVADGVGGEVCQPFARLIHSIENGTKHGGLIDSSRLVNERIDFDAGAPLEKADHFERKNYDEGGYCGGVRKVPRRMPCRWRLLPRRSQRW